MGPPKVLVPLSALGLGSSQGPGSRFSGMSFETNFLKNEKLFKKLKYRFLVESITIESATFLSCQKPMLRQIDWGVQNGLTTRNGVLQ